MDNPAPECCNVPMSLRPWGDSDTASLAWVCGSCGLVVHPGREHLIECKRASHRMMKKRGQKKARGPRQTLAEFFAAGGRVTLVPPTHAPDRFGMVFDTCFNDKTRLADIYTHAVFQIRW